MLQIPRTLAAAAAILLTAGLVACDSPSDGPEAQPAAGIPDVPVTDGGQTPHVADPDQPDLPPPGDPTEDTLPGQPEDR